MRALRVRYTPEVSGIIKKLHPTIKARIGAGINDILRAPLVGRELQFELIGFRSLHVGRHRIIYRINDEESCIEILFVGHRRDVYESFRDLLLGKMPPL